MRQVRNFIAAPFEEFDFVVEAFDILYSAAAVESATASDSSKRRNEE